LPQSSIENCVHKDLDNFYEEGKVLIMSRLFRKEYESTYLRDQNGYIKHIPKMPMQPSDWFNLSAKYLAKIEDLISKAQKMTNRVIETIDNFGKIVSEQWYETHSVASKQVEDGLAVQSKLTREQYDVRISFFWSKIITLEFLFYDC
jgi:hypothetical protein